MKNIPRASIHVGKDKKSFSAQVSNEAERRGWNENRYQQKNAEKEKNNHYNFSRKHLNFEIQKGVKIVPLCSNPIPLHDRLQQRLDELGFKPYMDANHPGQVAANSPNCTVGIIFSGDHDVMHRLAFGNQQFDPSDAHADQSDVTLHQGIYDWAMDTYRFACQKWGEENIIGFDVHCDETSIHAHVQTIPVDKVRKRGRAGSTYINKDNPGIRLSTKAWKALPKEERTNYTKTTTSKDEVERVSYAKVWGERAKDKSEYLSQLHTDYHNEVGCKYGLERGIPYNELSEEEKRGRRHKDKITLEAERQAKVALEEAKQKQQMIAEQTEVAIKALDKVKEYAVLATIDQKELTIPPLKISMPIKTAKDAIVKELGTSIPPLWGQKAWREERTTNINVAFNTLVTTLGSSRDSFVQDVHKTLNHIYSYYMQNLNKQIKANEQLHKENYSLKTENAAIKERLSQLDVHAVERVISQKDSIINQLNDRISRLTNKLNTVSSAYDSLKGKFNDLSERWNALRREPEFDKAERLVKQRKECEEQARKSRYQDTLDRFINEGLDALHGFARRQGAINFSESEALSIYYGIMAAAVKHDIHLLSENGPSVATKQFLCGMSWSGCTSFRVECVSNWTDLFAAKTSYNSDIIDNFLSYVDFVSCNAETFTSLGGSNGCADQLTNWDGTKKHGLGTLETKSINLKSATIIQYTIKGRFMSR